ncbi:gamma-glutamylcyclotransferase [Halosquirtibacter laminarini]|uniref:Gamma-glutamylcyclotransferase n=1 Tax=Halosquirtibacter laminarini TaxID=3374600 RepID=A0AC61NR95_9BACT|nr:gamma-glutamylcyclotransferase [Prolixibacteraceae bacterium]
MENNKHRLFSYGTLQLDRVQIETYGRLLTGTKDILPGYKLDKLKITSQEVIEKSGKEYHPIAVKTGKKEDFIEGTIFEITQSELEETDKYEVSDYQRILAPFQSGTQAWVYVAHEDEAL